MLRNYLLLALLFTFLPWGSALADQLTGRLAGDFLGSIDYEEPVLIDDGVINGEWVFDTASGEATVGGRFSSAGLSGDFQGYYDWDSQDIIGSWAAADDTESHPFTLALTQTDPMTFSGIIAGTTAGPEGPVPFSIQATVIVREEWTSLTGDMSGTWTGVATGTWSAEVQTFLGIQTYTGDFTVPADGEWSGNWEASLSNYGEILGNFEGIFDGIAAVSVLTPLGPVNLELPVRGVHEGGISLSGGTVALNGVWHELLETHGTSGSVTPDSINAGFGGGIELEIQSTAGGFPFSVDGTAEGGGSYIGTQASQGISATVTVHYHFSGSYQGSLQMQ